MRQHPVLYLLIFVLFVTVSYGSVLLDPTEPPKEFKERHFPVLSSGDTIEGDNAEPVAPAQRVGFVFFGHTTVALIDGVRYRVGDVYNESRIQDITKSQIILFDQGGQRWVLDVQK
ncbi:hypothetical protein [Chrysiogenes arsenatis]|uniref:hypothetical protein n=1 Tax=Chrysiogenes arsenatis TaxID=309797 RepID=UPI0003FF2843|nr:hypothetical protein [Chrysiogenes arsenatis]